MRKVVNLRLGDLVTMPSGAEAKVIGISHDAIEFEYCHKIGTFELSRVFINSVRKWA